MANSYYIGSTQKTGNPSVKNYDRVGPITIGAGGKSPTVNGGYGDPNNVFNYDNYSTPTATSTAASNAQVDENGNPLTMTDMYNNYLAGMEGTGQMVSNSDLYGQFASQGPSIVQGLGDDYYSQQKASRQEALRNEFFGPTGILSQRAGQESAAGRLGSGVGKVVLQETVTNPFAQQFAQIDRDVGMEQAQERARVQELNVQSENEYQQFLGNLAAQDSQNAIEAALANNDLKVKQSEIAQRLAEAEAGLLNDWEIAQLEVQVDSYFRAREDWREWQRINTTQEEIGLKYA